MSLLKMNFKKLQTFYPSLFIDQSHLFNVGLQLYLIFQPHYYIPKTLSNSEKVIWWKSKGLSIEKLTTLFHTDINLSLTIKWHEGSKFCLIFKGSCLNQKNETYTPNYRIKFFCCYELNT